MLVFLGGARAVTPALADAPEKRIALVIQNDLYLGGEPAKIADEDASTLAALLKQDGFDVELRKNVTGQEMRSAVDAFAARVTAKSVALLYFKGIGIQTAGRTHLIPVDAAIWSEDDVRRDGTPLDHVISDLDKRGARVKIAIVDAARPNPFERRFRRYSAGLAPPSLPEGALAIFAEDLNKAADPEPAPVSLFMKELVQQLKAANGAEDAFTRTREAVAKSSKGRELPWVSSTLVDPFYFVANPGKPASKPDAKPPSPAAAATPGKPSPPSPPEAKPPQAASPPSPQPGKPAPKPPAPPPPPPLPKPTAVEPRPGSTFSDCKRCPEMNVLAAAAFRMGSGTTPFDRPVHEVTIPKPFAIARSVVTRNEWMLCVDEGGCTFRPSTKSNDADKSPLVDVNWFDAKQYVDWLSKKTGKTYRLPTEAEWEYAARGGTTTAFAWGDTPGVGHANCTDCVNKSGRREAEPVRSYPTNGFGLFDMAGNVAQWLQDCWTLTYSEAPADGAAPAVTRCTMRVVRGGSFETSSAYIKPTTRFRAAADSRSPSIGFRVAREVK